MSIKVIGAGFPRTGTTSLKRMLEHLGYVKTYHMKELLVNPDMLGYWLELEKTGTTHWDELYEGYQATVDFPAYPWYKEHMDQYPDAKVILTYRPFEDWYKSVYNTIWQAGPQSLPEKLIMMSKLITNPRLRKVINCIKLVKRNVWGVHFQGRFEDKAFAEKIFNEHIESVKNTVPADRLLVMQISEGWEPLCKFLGHPIPDQDLPHLNKKENFRTMLKGLMKGEMI